MFVDKRALVVFVLEDGQTWVGGNRGSTHPGIRHVKVRSGA